jgi:hypothetical protein
MMVKVKKTQVEDLLDNPEECIVGQDELTFEDDAEIIERVRQEGLAGVQSD